MPDIRCVKINDQKHEVVIDGYGVSFLLQAPSGDWHLSQVGSDAIEMVSTLTDGAVFSGGTIDEAWGAALSDFFFAPKPQEGGPA